MDPPMQNNHRKRLLTKRKRTRQQGFIIDGNRKDFSPPHYEPLLDRHLQLFFVHQNRVQLLKQNRLINKRYEILDRSAKKNLRPLSGYVGGMLAEGVKVKSGQHGRAMSYDGTKHQQRSSRGMSQELEKPVLTGYERYRKKRHRSVNNIHQKPQNLPADKFNDFISRQKQKLQHRVSQQLH